MTPRGSRRKPVVLGPESGAPTDERPAPDTRPQTSEERWMSQAIAEARLARDEGEVPVGAVVVLDHQIVGRGHNRIEALHDPTAHAEIIALSAAAGGRGNWRLSGAELYVTTEPCLMCTGALTLARVRRIIFGVHDPKFGSCGSVYDIPWDNRFNHRLEVKPGILEPECRRLIQGFFRDRRRKTITGEGASHDSRI